MTHAPLTRDLIRLGASGSTDRIAVSWQGRDWTTGEINARANRFAHALMAQGLGRGDRVAVLLNNCADSVALDFALVKAGLNRVPLNSRLSLDEHARMIATTRPRAIIHGADLAARAEALGEHEGIARIGIGTGAVDLDRLAEQASDAEPDIAVAPDDVILTLFTSGTTGTLKAAQHTQASYAGIVRNVLLNLGEVRSGDAMLHAASLIHASGVFVLPYWLRGGRTVILPGFDPNSYLDQLGEHHITAINLVPTMLQMLMQRPDFADAASGTLEKVIYGASPMPRPVLEAAMDAWGADRFWQYFGQTECPLAISVLGPGRDHQAKGPAGSCGRPVLDVGVRLVDESGADVAPGEIGEIAVRGPSMMAGYFEAPELNAETRLPVGWLRTRDVGQFDDEGWLYLRDRTSDMIITGGYNVYPREVEDVLMAHPGVAECAVIGTPDATWIELVTACIVPHEGISVDEAELVAFVGERLAGYKKPRRVVIVEAIPKTAVGKLDRKVLRERFADGA
jgi:fatty-acyl-CoA synthase